MPLQASVARYGSASSFLSGVSTVLRGSLGPIGASAVVKRPRHSATVPDKGTVQLDRADHTRRQGATGMAAV